MALFTQGFLSRVFIVSGVTHTLISCLRSEIQWITSSTRSGIGAGSTIIRAWITFLLYSIIEEVLITGTEKSSSLSNCVSIDCSTRVTGITRIFIAARKARVVAVHTSFINTI